MMRVLLALMMVCVVPAHAQNTPRFEKSQEQARVHTDLASRYYQVGQVAVAVDEAKIALQSAADYVPAHTVLALIYAQLRIDDLADVHFNAALNAAAAQKLSQTDVRNSYAWFLCNSGQGERALQAFASVLQDPLYGSMDKALINAGACAARLKRKDLAVPYLNAAIDVNPDNAAAYVYRAHALLDNAQYSEAQSDMRRLGSMLPDSAELLWLKLRLATLQNNGQAPTLMQQLLREHPNSAPANWARSNHFELF